MRSKCANLSRSYHGQSGEVMKREEVIMKVGAADSKVLHTYSRGRNTIERIFAYLNSNCMSLTSTDATSATVASSSNRRLDAAAPQQGKACLRA